MPTARNPHSRPRRQLSRRGFIGSTAGAAACALWPFSAGAPEAQAAAARLRDDYVGRLCYNENPLGPSPLAVSAMSDELARGHRYADWFAESLRNDLATLHGVARSQIRAGCGATEMLRLCAYALADPDGNVVCPYPSYGGFGGDAAFMGAEVRHSDLDGDYRVDLDRILALVDANTSAVCITNPNNPTGPVLGDAEIAAFVAALPPQVAVVIDEAYHEYVHDTAYRSAIELVRQDANVVVLRTFSKAFGLAGVRIGYLVGHPDLVNLITPWQIWGTVSRPALVAARAALTDAQHVSDTVALNDQTKQYCYDQLDLMGLEYIPSETNFFMVDVGQNAGPVASDLASRGVMVRTGWGMGQHLRVSTGTQAEMETFISELQDILSAMRAGGTAPATQTALFGNFPNPVRDQTSIRFALQAPDRVRLEVFDVRGRLVRRLLDEPCGRGYFDIGWDRRDGRGRQVPGGTYFYRFRAGAQSATRRMILL